MDFLVNRLRLEKTLFVSGPPLVLKGGDILIRIVRFAFTANNVSYAATGDALGYWKFFPATTKDKTYGRVPVWGVGVVQASRCAGVLEGRRVYGYFPMSQYVVMHPINQTPQSFVDGMLHRRSLPAVYNQYLWCDEDPFYTPRTEEAMMVLRPLFFTSWLIVDFFLNSPKIKFYGANTVIISSASSKTSIGLAFCLRSHNQNQQNQGEKIRIVGLTSPGNQALVHSLQIYDQIVLYDSLENSLDASQPSCFVDMAGNTNVTTRLHRHLEEKLKYTCLVGASHVTQGGKPKAQLPGPRPVFFFAPKWTARRVVELGGSSSSVGKQQGMEILLHQVRLDYQRFVNWCLGTSLDGSGIAWLQMKHYFGEKQVKEGYQACLQGKIQPDTAVIMSLWDGCNNESASASFPPSESRL